MLPLSDEGVMGVMGDFTDGEGCEAGEEEAAAAAAVAAFLACFALAASLGREKSPKSESESLSLSCCFFALAIGLAVADFFGTALELPELPPPPLFLPLLEDFFDDFLSTDFRRAA